MQRCKDASFNKIWTIMANIMQIGHIKTSKLICIFLHFYILHVKIFIMEKITVNNSIIEKVFEINEDPTLKSLGFEIEPTLSTFDKSMIKQLFEINDDPTLKSLGFEIEPTAGLNTLSAFFDGPKDTIYEKGVFRVDINLMRGHPFNAPRVKFATKIFHPNITEFGSICFDIFKKEWWIGLTLKQILLNIYRLLSNPDFENPSVPEIASIYFKDKEHYNSIAKHWVYLYAKDKLLKL